MHLAESLLEYLGMRHFIKLLVKRLLAYEGQRASFHVLCVAPTIFVVKGRILDPEKWFFHRRNVKLIKHLKKKLSFPPHIVKHLSQHCS